MYLGENKISKIYLGANEVLAKYLGLNKIFTSIAGVLERLGIHYSTGSTLIVNDIISTNEGEVVNGLVDMSLLTYVSESNAVATDKTIDSVTVSATASASNARVVSDLFEVKNTTTYRIKATVENLFDSQPLLFRMYDQSGTLKANMSLESLVESGIEFTSQSTQMYFKLYCTGGTAVLGSARFYGIVLSEAINNEIIAKDVAVSGNSIRWDIAKTDIGDAFVNASVPYSYNSIIPIQDLGANYGNQVFFDFDYEKCAIFDQELIGGDLEEANDIIGAKNSYENLSQVVDALTWNIDNGTESLDILNYVSNYSNVHGKLLDFTTQWNGYRYWFAYTPYPDVTEENPSIAVSNDLVTWDVPVGLTNPLDIPVAGTDSDAHLVYREDTGTLELWWRNYDSPRDITYRRTTTDGVSWTAKENVIDEGYDILSPSVIYEDGMYKCWGVTNANREIIYIESVDTFTWSPPEIINPSWGTLTPFHLDVISTSLGKEFLVQAYDTGNNNNSADLYYFVQKPSKKTSPVKVFLTRSSDPLALDYVGLYRSTFIKNSDGTYTVIYSGIATNSLRSQILRTSAPLLDGAPYYKVD